MRRKGDIYRIDGRNNGTHVVVALREPVDAESWYAVVIGGDDKTYTPGRYDIVIAPCDFQHATKVDLAKMWQRMADLERLIEYGAGRVGVHQDPLWQSTLSAMGVMRSARFEDMPTAAEIYDICARYMKPEKDESQTKEFWWFGRPEWSD
jgi:hypothetical protein